MSYQTLTTPSGQTLHEIERVEVTPAKGKAEFHVSIYIDFMNNQLFVITNHNWDSAHEVKTLFAGKDMCSDLAEYEAAKRGVSANYQMELAGNGPWAYIVDILRRLNKLGQARSSRANTLADKIIVALASLPEVENANFGFSISDEEAVITFRSDQPGAQPDQEAPIAFRSMSIEGATTHEIHRVVVNSMEGVPSHTFSVYYEEKKKLFYFVENHHRYRMSSRFLTLWEAVAWSEQWVSLTAAETGRIKGRLKKHSIPEGKYSLEAIEQSLPKSKRTNTMAQYHELLEEVNLRYKQRKTTW